MPDCFRLHLLGRMKLARAELKAYRSGVPKCVRMEASRYARDRDERGNSPSSTDQLQASSQ